MKKRCVFCQSDFEASRSAQKYCGLTCRSHDRSKRAMDRFWTKMDRAAPGGCWVWSGMVSKDGYGKAWRMNKSERAHRLAWMLANQTEISPDLVVMHSCDNRLCCNPEHLSLGTVQDNVRDRDKKNRQARGESGGNTRLSESDVISIRASNKTNARIAEQFGTSVANVHVIRSGQTWRHLLEKAPV